MPVGSSLFELILAHQAAQANAYRAQQAQTRQENTAQANSDRDFWLKKTTADRQHEMDLASSQAKMAGALGRPNAMPDTNDSDTQAELQPAYMSGEFEKYKTDRPVDIAAMNNESHEQVATANNARAIAEGEAKRQQDINKFLEGQSFKDRQLAEQERYHNILAMLGRDRRDQSLERSDDKLKVQLGSKLGPLESEHADLSQLEENANNGAAGMGPFEGRIPGVLLDVGDKLGMDSAHEAIQNRQAAGGLKRLVSLATGGKNLTATEMQAVLESYGISRTSPDAVLQEGVRRLKRDAAIGERQIKNSFPDRVVKDYQEGSSAIPIDDGANDQVDPNQLDELRKGHRGTSN